MHQVPAEFFLHFLAKLQVQANSVRDMPHKGLPVYKSNARKVSYKIFQLERLQNALDEQGLVQLNTNTLYAGHTQFTEEASHGTADEEIARAKQRAYQPTFLTGRYDKTQVNNRHCLSYSSDEIEDPLL